MKNITIIAITLAAVIVISGTAVFLINNNLNSDDEIDKGSLPVFGNANSDNRINSEDIDLINKMIEENLPIDEHPFADANRDGVLNSDDVDIVNKLIKGEQTTVTFVDQYDLFIPISGCWRRSCNIRGPVSGSGMTAPWNMPGNIRKSV